MKVYVVNCSNYKTKIKSTVGVGASLRDAEDICVKHLNKYKKDTRNKNLASIINFSNSDINGRIAYIRDINNNTIELSYSIQEFELEW